MTRARRHQAGFTMVEMMVSLVISSLLVGMILSIFTRMSTAYRTQQHVAELQQVLVSGQDLIQHDVRQAGFGMADGFRVAGPAGVHAAVELRDNASGFGPDELHVFYADPSARAKVTVIDNVPGNAFASFEVDAPDLFESGELAVISNYSFVPIPPFSILMPRFEACVVKLGFVNATSFGVKQGGDWGTPDNDQCDAVRVNHAAPFNTMVYRFKARGYRVDPTRRDLAVLQLSPSGALLADDWQDLGIGFTDLQLASRWYEGEDDSARKTTDTADVDTDATRDWYSGADQNVLTAFAAADPTRPLLMELRVSVAVRTTSKLDTIGSNATPAFIDATRPDNNDLGNRTAVTLAGVPDASRPQELRGAALFRYATVGSDTRNLSVGR